ncbi:MAG: hypothetical protein KGZ82_05235 [Bacteroidales bacterium]|nr:hypothetical protein [Bacteroidales bacterium]
MRFGLKLNLPSIVIMLLCSIFNTGISQNKEVVRVEFPSKTMDQSYHTETLGEKGVLVFYESNEITEEGERKWFFNLLNNNLTEQWLQYVALKDGMVFEKTVHTPQQVFLLFTIRDNKKSLQSAFQILTYSIDKETFNLLGAPMPPEADCRTFDVVGSHAFIGLTVQKKEAQLLAVDMRNAQLISLSPCSDGQCIIQETYHSRLSNELVIGFKKYTGNRFDADLFVVYNMFGAETYRFEFRDEQQRYLHSYTFSDDAGGIISVVGSYDQAEKRKARLKDANDELMNEAYGFFFLKFDPTGIKLARFVELSTIDNIYSSMSSYDLIRSMQRQSRKQNKDEKRSAVAFQFYNPQLVLKDNELVYAVEAFRPQFRTETRMDYDFYGRPIPYTYTVFDGFAFYGALFAGFNSDGQLTWNNNFEMRDLISFNLEKHLLVHDEQDGLLLAYILNGKIISKMIQKDQDIGQVEQVKIESDYETDRMLGEEHGNITHWYSDSFIISGVQKIMNNRLRDNNERTVFYLNKFQLE